MLMWLLGDENNKQFNWTDANIKQMLVQRQKAAKANYFYSLVGDITEEIKLMDPNHPVALSNSDTEFLELINQHCPNIDIYAPSLFDISRYFRDSINN